MVHSRGCPFCGALLPHSGSASEQTVQCWRCHREIDFALASPPAPPHDAERKRVNRWLLAETIVFALVVIHGIAWVIAYHQDAIDRLIRLGLYFGVVDLAVILILAARCFPGFGRQLKSPQAGWVLSVPAFWLLAVAIVIFFFVTCFGLDALTPSTGGRRP